jgi:hypothetical protein
MESNEHWIYRGRQEHGWFGSGTAPTDDTAPGPAGDGDAGNGAAGAQALEQHVGLVVDYAADHFPRSDRRSFALRMGWLGGQARLNSVMPTWVRDADVHPEIFRQRFFGREGNAKIAGQMQAVAQQIAHAQTHLDLSAAAGHLADALQMVGLDAVPRFLARAQARAEDPQARVIPAQFAVPLPPLAAPVGAGPADDGPDPAAKAAGAAVARAGRRANQVLTEIGQGHLDAALGHALLGRPYPAAVDDPALSVLHNEAGGEGDAAPPAGGESAEPAPERITVSPDRRRYILDGDGPGKGGGHRPGLGKDNKTEFPRGWTDDKIIEEVEDVANDPNSRKKLEDDGRTVISGTREGVDIRVVVETDGKNVVSGYPTNLPRNPNRITK